MKLKLNVFMMVGSLALISFQASADNGPIYEEIEAQTQEMTEQAYKDAVSGKTREDIKAGLWFGFNQVVDSIHTLDPNGDDCQSNPDQPSC